jgi:hypothetical protein
MMNGNAELSVSVSSIKLFILVANVAILIFLPNAFNVDSDSAQQRCVGQNNSKSASQSISTHLVSKGDLLFAPSLTE